MRKTRNYVTRVYDSTPRRITKLRLERNERVADVLENALNALRKFGCPECKGKMVVKPSKAICTECGHVLSFDE